MIKRYIAQISAFCMICMLIASSAIPAYAGWEPGIVSATKASVEASQPEEVDAKEVYRTEVFQLLNTQRTSAGLEPLNELPKLMEPSDLRANEASISFSHTRPNGSSCSTVFTDNQIAYKHIGENLAYGFKNPSDLVNAWMNSKSHRENILSENFMYGGIGYFQNDEGVIYCSLLLYTPKAPSES